MVYKICFIFLLSASLSFAQRDTLSDRKAVPSPNALAELRDQLDDYFTDSNFNSAVWGVLVKSLRTGEIIYKRNVDKLFIPASEIKLFTSAAALLLLGPNYTFETNFFANGELLRGTLKGDLIIRGYGDPSISNRFGNASVTSIFEKWADTLKARGIYEITGNIYGDDSAFDNLNYGKGWPLDYESSWFAAPSGALSLNENIVVIKVEPTDINFPAKISIIPETKYITVTKNVMTVSDESEENIVVHREPGSNTITITGKIKKGTKQIIEHSAIINPLKYFLTVLEEVMTKKGIICRGKIASIDEADKTINDDDLIPLFTNKSVSLKSIVTELNKNSNNFYAEQILKLLGYEEYGYGSVDNGVKACREILNSMGINPDNMVMADGSGLSRLNLVTPRQIVNLLSFMYKNEKYATFYESLPIAAVDGTLKDRMARSAAENNVRAKPGFNNYVSALSGYLKTVNGEPLVFSIIVNNFLAPVSLANYIEDNVCHRLVNFSRN